MSPPLYPALAVLEVATVSRGVLAGDAMAKRAPVAVLYAGTVHPGKFVVLVGGGVADVEESLAAGREAAGGARVDELLLPDVHPAVAAAAAGRREAGAGEAIGVVETATVAALVGAADRGVKGALVTLREVRLADDLGGKAYCVFRGDVADVEAAVERAVAGLAPGALLDFVVVPRVHPELLDNLDADPELRRRLAGGS